MEASLEVSHQRPEAREYLVIGAGVMGKNYIGKLLNAGVHPDQISVVDIDSDKLDKLLESNPQFEGISIGTKMPQGRSEKAFVLSNSPAHLSNLEELQAPSVLVEKPLVTAQQSQEERERVLKILDTFQHAYVAYVIEFSPAVEKLAQFMEEKELRVSSGQGVWQKNRRWSAASTAPDGSEITEKNARPTAGDLEDEMTHPLALLMYLSSINQDFKEMQIDAELHFDEYVKPGVQEQLKKVDSSVPLQPNSSTQLDLKLVPAEGAKDPVALSMWSSFVADEQEREVSANLVNDQTGERYRATMTFDKRIAGEVKPSDLLTIQNSSGEIKYEEKFSLTDKLQSVVNSFLEAAETGAAHPGLKEALDSLGVVDVAALAEKSHALGETMILELDERI